MASGGAGKSGDEMMVLKNFPSNETEAMGAKVIMRKVFLLAALTLISISLIRADALPRNKTQTLEATKQEILQMEEQQNEALRNNDADLLGAMCADELAWTNASGVLFPKEQMLADIRSGKQKNANIEHKDVRLHVYGTTVVVTGLSTSKYVYNGRQATGVRRFTNVWVKQGRKWLLVVHHVTPIATS
jgi:ketosteroid isomerase-like protein